MRISDWSSDVCSSDLTANCLAIQPLSLFSIGNILYMYWQGRCDGNGDIDGTCRRRAGFFYESAIPGDRTRSEEHTSELQSLMRNSYAVFCLKKKKTLENTINQQLSDKA